MNKIDRRQLLLGSTAVAAVATLRSPAILAVEQDISFVDMRAKINAALSFEEFTKTLIAEIARNATLPYELLVERLPNAD